MGKVRCASCGVGILADTAARNAGLCVPCARGTATACRICGGRALVMPGGAGNDTLCRACRVELERRRPTRIEEFVRRFGRGDCALLVRLFRLDERIRRSGAAAWIGLNLVDPPVHGGTEVTPANSFAIAETGGNDVHFSLVSMEGFVSDGSMVVMTNPSTGGSAWESNVIVGENLRDFLSLGSVCGYSCLERLPYDRAGVLEELRSGSTPEEFGEEGSNVLREYRRELGVTPWTDIEARLEGLERRKRSVLEFDHV